MDSVSIVPAVEAANQAGIPVVAADNGIYGGKLTGTFIANNYLACCLKAHFRCAALDHRSPERGGRG
jgi:hypothetical protein